VETAQANPDGDRGQDTVAPKMSVESFPADLAPRP
jgi:hypothetical protein